MSSIAFFDICEKADVARFADENPIELAPGLCFAVLRNTVDGGKKIGSKIKNIGSNWLKMELIALNPGHECEKLTILVYSRTGRYSALSIELTVQKTKKKCHELEKN